MFARWTAALLVTAVLAVTPAHADTAADFYKGKQVNLIVGYGPGGGYDIYARVLARHFGRFIPGNPNIVVQNMPGAGSLRAANHLYNIAPKDGTAIATFARNMPLLGILGSNPNVQFNARRFTWLGSSSSFANDAYILIVRTDAPVKSIDEARRPDLPALVLGGTAEGATGNDVPPRQAGRGLSGQRGDLPGDRARRSGRTHRRSFVGQVGEAGMAQAEQRLPRARPIRARHPAS